MNVGCSSYNKNGDGKTTRSTLANDSAATSSPTTTIRNKAFYSCISVISNLVGTIIVIPRLDGFIYSFFYLTLSLCQCAPS